MTSVEYLLDFERITEPAFLLVELRYTAGQVLAQLGHLNNEQRASPGCDGQSVDSILSAMVQAEENYQTEYQRLFPGFGFNSSDESSQPMEVAFSQARTQTVVQLSVVAEPWGPELVDLVKQHLTHDRRLITDLAQVVRERLDST